MGGVVPSNPYLVRNVVVSDRKVVGKVGAEVQDVRRVVGDLLAARLRKEGGARDIQLRHVDGVVRRDHADSVTDVPDVEVHGGLKLPLGVRGLDLLYGP